MRYFSIFMVLVAVALGATFINDAQKQCLSPQIAFNVDHETVEERPGFDYSCLSCKSAGKPMFTCSAQNGDQTRNLERKVYFTFNLQSNAITSGYTNAGITVNQKLFSLLLYILMMVGFWYFLFKVYAKKPVIEDKQKGNTHHPTNYKPAKISYLVWLNNGLKPAFISTLFDLANKGFLKMEVIKENVLLGMKQNGGLFHINRKKYENSKSDLAGHEEHLLSFLISEIANSDCQFTTKQIRQAGESKMQDFKRRWYKAIKKEVDAEQWIDQTSFTGRKIGILVSLLLIAMFVLLAVFYGGLFLIPAVMAFPFFIASFFLFRRTEEGEVIYQQCQDFKSYLANSAYQLDSNQVSKESFYQYLVYGIALGLDGFAVKKIADDLDINYPDTESHILHGSTATDHRKGEAIYQIAHATGSAFNSSSGRSGGRSLSASGGLGPGY